MKKVFSLALAFCFVFLFITDACAAKPVIKQQPESATTTSDRTVTFSVSASGSISSYSWFFVNPSTGKKISGKKLQKNKTLKGIKVAGTNRPTITLTHVPDAMNGWLVYCVVAGSGYKVDSEYATLLVYGMDPPETAPVTTGLEITAQPKDSGISEKGTLTFTVKYTGLAEKITWGFINPKDGQKVIGKNIQKKFKDMKVSGINKAKLTLSNVPEGMVGWKVYAHFKIKGNELNSDFATVLSAEEVAALKAAEEAKKKEEEEKKAAEAAAAPLKVTTNPKSAGISEKGTLTFTVKYSGTPEKISWIFVNPEDGKKVTGKNILTYFEEMKASGLSKAKLTLSNVPEGMVGWQVYARLTANGTSVNSKKATVLSAEEAAAAKEAAAKKKEEAAKAEAAKTEAPAAETGKSFTVTCSDSVLKALDNAGKPVGEPSARLIFEGPGSFIVSSDKPIRSWTINGIGNVPSSPVTEFQVSDVQEDLVVSLVFE